MNPAKLLSIPLSGIRIDSQIKNAPSESSEPHCHEYYELFYVMSGSCRYLAEEKYYDLHEGDFVLMPPLCLHYTQYLFGECKRTLIYFSPEDISPSVSRFLPFQTDFFSAPRLFQVPEVHLSAIDSYLSLLLKEEKIHDERSREIKYNFFQNLLLYCSRICNFIVNPPLDIRTTDRPIILAAQFIGTHYMEHITSADIAKSVNFSPNYLSRRFREVTGIGLHEYLMFIRLNHAALELLSTHDSITEIAFRCGFSDSNYFKDAFKKRYGIAPRSYRKE